jgi:hypothetical protein
MRHARFFLAAGILAALLPACGQKQTPAPASLMSPDGGPGADRADGSLTDMGALPSDSAEVRATDGAAPPSGSVDGGAIPDSDGLLDAVLEVAADRAVSPDTTANATEGGPMPLDGSPALASDASVDTRDAERAAADGPGAATCPALAQAPEAQFSDESFAAEPGRRPDGLQLEPKLYTVVRFAQLVQLGDPRTGTKTGRRLKETWQLRRVPTTGGKSEDYLDVVSQSFQDQIERRATFRLSIAKDLGGMGLLWKLSRFCGDAGLDDLEDAVLDLDWPDYGSFFGTNGTAKDGRWWRREFQCMGRTCQF